MDDQRKMAQAQQAYKDGNIEQARRLLKGVDHPKARRALTKLNRDYPPRPSLWQRVRIPITIAAFALLILIFAVSRAQFEANRAQFDAQLNAQSTVNAILLNIVPTEPVQVASPTSLQGISETVVAATAERAVTLTAFVQSTDEPLSESDQLRDAIRNIDGVEDVLLTSILRDPEGLPIVGAEVLVRNGFNTTVTADTYLQAVQQTLATARFSFVSIIINDGNTAVDYIYDFEGDVWSQTELP